MQCLIEVKRNQSVHRFTELQQSKAPDLHSDKVHVQIQEDTWQHGQPKKPYIDDCWLSMQARAVL